MSTPDQVMGYIREVVAEAGMEHGLIGDSDSLAVRVLGEDRGSSGIVVVTCKQLDEGNSIVFLVAPTVRGPSLDEGSALGSVQEVINGLNENALFGRWVFHEEDQVVNLEHELVGDNLSPEAIKLIISAMGRGASDLEGFFMNVFPGCEPGINSHPDLKADEIDWA